MKLIQEYLNDIEDNAKEVIENILQYKFSNPEINKIDNDKNSSRYLYLNASNFIINKSNTNIHKKLLNKILDFSKAKIDKINKEKIIYYAYFEKDRKKIIPNFNSDLFIRNLLLIFYEDPENELIKELFKFRKIKNKNFKICFEKRKHLSNYLYECGEDNSISSNAINGIFIYKDNINMFTSTDEITVDDDNIIIFDLQNEEDWNIHNLFGKISKIETR